METPQEKVKFYDEFYAHGDFAYYSPEFTTHVLRSIFGKCGIPPGALFVDVGCGTGFYTETIRTLGYRTIGVDISQAGIQKALHQYPASTFVVADATRMPFPQKSFDAMYVLGVSLINTPVIDDIRGFISSMMRYLKPRGWLILMGDSDLSGIPTPRLSWFNHSWDDIRRWVPDGEWCIHGPYLTHFRLIRLAPVLSMNRIATWMMRKFAGSRGRRIVILIRKN